jgi:hypothetical protein
LTLVLSKVATFKLLELRENIEFNVVPVDVSMREYVRDGQYDKLMVQATDPITIATIVLIS